MASAGTISRGDFRLIEAQSSQWGNSTEGRCFYPPSMKSSSVYTIAHADAVFRLDAPATKREGALTRLNTVRGRHRGGSLWTFGG